MPGLFGCISLDSSVNLKTKVEDMSKICSYHPSRTLWKEDRLSSKFSEVRRWKRSIPGPAPYEVSEDGLGLLVDGWILSVEGEEVRDSAQAGLAVLESYRRKGPAFIENIDGEFNLFLSDEKNHVFMLANDRFGLRPLFYSQNDHVFAFGFEGKQVVSAMDNTPELDLQYAWNYLSYGRAVLGDYSFFKNVKMLRPACRVVVKAGKTDTTEYWRLEYKPQAITKSFTDELVDTFKTAVKRRIFSGVRYGLTLSGGLDSRMVAAALAEYTDQRVTAVTFGTLDSEEVRYACTVADRLGIAQKLIELVPGDFLKNARYGARLSEGHDLFVQSYGIKVFDSVKEEIDAAATGLALDLTLGGSYIDSLKTAVVQEKTDIERSLKKKLSYFPSEMLQKMFSADYRRIDKKNEHAIDELLKRCWQEDAENTADAFALYARVHRIVSFRQGWQRLFLEDITPTFDYTFMNLISKVPPEERRNHRIYIKFLEKLSPETAYIPYQRTNLPAIVPTQYWDEAIRIETERERLYDRINCETKLGIKYPRYSTNYGDWLRFDGEWRSFVSEILLPSNSKFYDLSHLDKTTVSTMVEEHQKGICDHRQRLLQIISLALAIEQNL
jgi:asparagine synthase (glutamine-hydrolysing)